MSKNSHQVEEAERIAIGLYQEKITYWRNLMTEFINNILRQKGLKPEDCTIDLRTGVITIKEKGKEAA